MARWRVIGIEEHDAYSNMAIDEAISNSVCTGESLPTMRFYRWRPCAVSIGYFQGMNDEVNIGACRELGIDCVRRKTGGGAVYHDTDGEITYSVIAPEAIMPKGIRESYMEVCGWIVKGLAELGIAAEFAPINDIIAGGKKISGSAQTRRDGMLIQHGTVLYRINRDTMFRVLKVSKEKIADKQIASADQRVTCVSEMSDASIGSLYAALMHGFTDGKEYFIEGLSAREETDSARLALEYMDDRWNLSR
jgi:lipoate-protein ligase A